MNLSLFFLRRPAREAIPLRAIVATKQENVLVQRRKAATTAALQAYVGEQKRRELEVHLAAFRAVEVALRGEAAE